MLDTTETSIASLIVHRVGNKLREEGIVASNRLHTLSADLQMTLLNYFLAPFQNSEVYRFAHSSELHLNEMFSFATALFSGDGDFIPITVNALKHLYSTCDHPKTKAGEVSFAKFDGVLFGGQSMQALGVFKSERKETFLTVDNNPQQILFSLSRGIPAKQFDKGCLILDTSKDDGFRLLVLDTNAEETRFWHDRFLNVVPIHDDRFFTEACIKVCQDFLEQQKSQDGKAENVLRVRKAIRYFDENETYDLKQFASEVFEDPKVASEFKAFRKAQERNTGISTPESFAISTPAVKKAKRQLRRNIRLDTKMEVKLNFSDPDSQSQLLERGYDGKKCMFYYKLYFNKEL